MGAVTKCHQFLTFCVPPALQRGVAAGLTGEAAYFRGMGAELARKRALLARALAASGFAVLPAGATYFMVADATPLLLPGEDDVGFCARLATDAGVAAIPLSPFYTDATARPPPRGLVRFCFCKQDAVLEAAGEALARYFGEGGAGRVGRA